jgi:predicted DCC family thiol-disulfide oxidoreductase YuxK
MTQPTLYYDGSCGLCRREIDHLRPRLAHQIDLVDISQAGFCPPPGYQHSQMMAHLHFHDGERMHVGLSASLGYWHRAGGGFRWLARGLAVPGLFQCADWAYNRWAAWRMRRLYCQPRR